MEEWKEYKLGDCVEAVIDNRGKSAPTKPLGEFPLLEINSIGGYYPNYSVIRKYVDKVTYNTWFRSGHPICGDILIPTVGTIGIISIMDNHKACIAQNLIALRTKKEISNIFIYYFLKSPIVKKQLINLDIGGVQPSIKVPHLLNLSISLPEKDIQHKIASILSSLDDKIEVNRKINENLEQQAQALFKSWFVDFEPFKDGEFVESELGMIPKGWRTGQLGEHCKCLLGGTPSRNREEYWNGNIAWINSGEVNKFRITMPSEYITEEGLNHSATKLLPRKTTVIAITGATLGQVSLLEIETCANQSVIGILENKEYPYSFVYPLIKEKIGELMSHMTGGAQQHINKNNVEGLDIVIPSHDVMASFRDITFPIYDKIGYLCQENDRLAELRDTLLPKLMSGELKVNELNI